MKLMIIWNGERMERIAVIAISICLLLTSCSIAYPYGGEGVLQTRTVLSVVIAVDQQTDYETREAAGIFLQKLWEYSGGYITGEMFETEDLPQALSSGDADFALLGCREHGEVSTFLSEMAEPFRYQNYLHFTMAANSKEVLESLRQHLSPNWGIFPLAAYYQGSNFLLSDFNIAEYQNFTNPISLGMSGESRREAAVLLAVENSGASALADVGAFVAETNEVLERKRQLEEGTVNISEFTVSELESISWDAVNLYAVRSYHDINPLILMANEAFHNQLSPRQKAIVMEAASCLFDALDNTYLQREDALYSDLLDKGFLEGQNITKTRNRIISIQNQRKSTAIEETYFRELLAKSR